MSGKKILAVIFAALILIKLLILLISPGTLLALSQAFLGHTTRAEIGYLVLLVILGGVIFTSLDLIDVAVVMLFTSVLVGLSLIPYTQALQGVGQEIARVGFGKAWLAWIIWVGLAAAVLYRVFGAEESGD
jgi:hypothetical protein